jgi:CelD/BcsL family acetyltransferase involved in cellulose biosynthesis
MKWSRLPITEFDGFTAEWDQVNPRALADAPFMRSIFMRPLLRQFAQGNEQIVVGRDGGRVAVAAILQPVRPGMWQTFQPSQLPLGALLCANDADVREVFSGLLTALPGFAISLGITQLDPVVVPRPAQQPRLQTLDYIQTAWVDINGTFEAYWDARGKNLRHNIRKQRSKLDEQKIATRLETLTRPEDVAAVVRDYGALESAGWKASQGTAIHPDNPQGLFYREMLENYCGLGQGRLYRYWFGDRVVAVDLCIASEQALVILKTTYDETQQTYSPAFLMRHAAFGDLFKEGSIRRIEFYGKLMDWHKRWTDESRTLYHANFYRYDWMRRARDALAARRSTVSVKSDATPPEPAG